MTIRTPPAGGGTSPVPPSTLDIHVAPVLLGAGTRLFEGVDPMQFELAETPASPNVTHVSYVVPKPLPSEQGDG